MSNPASKPAGTAWHDSRLVSTIVGLLIGAVLSFGGSYAGTSTRTTILETRYESIDKRLERIEAIIYGRQASSSNPAASVSSLKPAP